MVERRVEGKGEGRKGEMTRGEERGEGDGRRYQREE